MKRICCWLILLLLALPAACLGEEAFPEEIERLLTVTVNGVDYRLGRTTAEEIAADGWRYEIEDDGVIGFCDPDSEGWFYVATMDGGTYAPVICIDLTAADEIPVEYCGFSADAEGSPDDISLWDWLIDAFDARENEEGILIARVPLPDGTALQIETSDIRVRLSLLPAE